jgi:hypothetical protein
MVDEPFQPSQILKGGTDQTSGGTRENRQAAEMKDEKEGDQRGGRELPEISRDSGRVSRKKEIIGQSERADS